MFLSVVIPVYKSEESLPLLADGIEKAGRALGAEWEIIFVDDASQGKTWEILQDLHRRDPGRICILRLARNAGQHNAILCGFTQTRGEIVITMDDDLQNPPEEIPKLIEAVQRGFDVVIGAYETKQHGRARNMSGAMVDKVIRFLFRLPHDFQLTSFRAIRRPVIEAAVEMGGSFPYITAMLLANSTNQTNVPVKHVPRLFGKSNYNLRNTVQLAANLIFSYSSLPVLFVAGMCAVCLIFSLGLAAWTLIGTIISGASVPGWASIMVTLSMMNAMTLFSLAIFGGYISRVSRQIAQPKHRFVIAEQYISRGK
jgi:polyisoprenyl-phosphate glycosyltransferase